MASAAESPSIIEEYSQTFTTLQAGKRELIQYGVNAVTLNRFIIDASEASGQTDNGPVLTGIDIGKVPHGDTDEERFAYCEAALEKLVKLQEEIFVLQKSAREKGISGGLLTIIGQAASQSPEDNGASVLQQLSELVRGGDKDIPDPSTPLPSSPTTALSGDEDIVSEVDRTDLEPMTGLQQLVHTLINHWKSFVVDASVCAIAAGIAISLIN